MYSGHRSTIWRLVFVLVATLITLALASGSWAAPHQSGLRQTVPTRTPTKLPTNTPVPSTATPPAPTDEPAQPTATAEQPTATTAVTAEATATETAFTLPASTATFALTEPTTTAQQPTATAEASRTTFTPLPVGAEGTPSATVAATIQTTPVIIETSPPSGGNDFLLFGLGAGLALIGVVILGVHLGRTWRRPSTKGPAE